MYNFLETYSPPKLNIVETDNLKRPITKCEIKSVIKKLLTGGFPGGAVVKNPPANAGDTGSSPGLGGSHMPRSN